MSLALLLGLASAPALLYGALLESEVEGQAESALGRYADEVGRRLQEDPLGDSWRDVTGAGILGEKRPTLRSLIISAKVTVQAGIFLSTSLEVRCYDIAFTNIGTPDQRYDLDKISGCEPERRGPAVTGSPRTG
ncbi:hypothetical protein AB0C33_15200 [Nonomuraea sp. NPDC048881]|uniref:hypothetical protein n=1 Tax=Nonomuraea sp. NPDC048881 TaxID=3155030 RepID=UPI0033F0C44F